jgi:transcriptional regulator with XRE-family HTH domain
LTNRVNINPLLDEVIKESGLTQEELAKDLGYDRAYLSQARKEGTKKLENKLLAYLDNVRKSNTNKKAPSGSEEGFKDKYIALLEKRVTELEVQKGQIQRLEKRLDELLNNQLVSEAMSQSYQEYVIETFWKLQGKKVVGKDILRQIQHKAVEKLTFSEEGIHIEASVS